MTNCIVCRCENGYCEFCPSDKFITDRDPGDETKNADEVFLSVVWKFPSKAHAERLVEYFQDTLHDEILPYPEGHTIEAK